MVVLVGPQMEYEDVLPWHEFAVRLPQYMMYRLPEGLDILINDEAMVLLPLSL
jgi:hypothetical protein